MQRIGGCKGLVGALIGAALLAGAGSAASAAAVLSSGNPAGHFYVPPAGRAGEREGAHDTNSLLIGN